MYLEPRPIVVRHFVMVLLVLFVQISPLHGETINEEEMDEEARIEEMAERMRNATGISLPWEIKKEGEILEFARRYDSTPSFDNIISDEFKVGNVWILFYTLKWGGDTDMIVYDMEQEKVIFKNLDMPSINGEVKLYHQENVKPDHLIAFEAGGSGGTGLYATSFLIYCFDNGKMKKCFDDDLEGYDYGTCESTKDYEYKYEISPDRDNIWQVRKTGKQVTRTCPEGTSCKECEAQTDGREEVKQVDTTLQLGQ